MSGPHETPEERISALQAELEAVKKREAQFRVHMVQEFLDRGERNTYVHTLHEERTALRRREQEASADLEELTRKLERETARATLLERSLQRTRASWAWRLSAPFRLLGRALGPRPADDPSPSAPEVPGCAFTYYLHTSPFRIYREAHFTLRGWAWPEGGGSISAIRVVVDGREFRGRLGIEEPEVIARYGAQPANPRPGFEITFETPAGRHQLSLEAEIGSGGWRRIMGTSIWCEPIKP